MKDYYHDEDGQKIHQLGTMGMRESYDYGNSEHHAMERTAQGFFKYGDQSVK